jgi:hypothetical protein
VCAFTLFRESCNAHSPYISCGRGWSFVVYHSQREAFSTCKIKRTSGTWYLAFVFLSRASYKLKYADYVTMIDTHGTHNISQTPRRNLSRFIRRGNEMTLWFIGLQVSVIDRYAFVLDESYLPTSSFRAFDEIPVCNRACISGKLGARFFPWELT